MIRREHFINKLRDLGYKFKLQRKRVYIWRRTGSTHRIAVPKTDLLEESYVVSSLRQAGCSEDEINRFLASTKS
jgi:hypothetical protein